MDSLESAGGSKTCSECGSSFPSVAKFCPDCGATPTASSASVSHESSGPEISCYSCNERIPAAAKFCPECGGKPTAPSASTSRPITDDGSGPPCAGCKKPISGRVVKANATTWHPDCFQCSQCAQPIEKDFVIRNLKPWCDKCVEWEKKEKKAGRTGGTRPVGSDERQSSDSQSTPALRTDQVVCHQCNKSISGPAVSYSGQYYHKACLTCKGCGQPLDPDKGFLTRAGQLYHEDCAKKLDGGDKSKRLCAECGKDLGSKYLSDGGKLYHASCIVCSVCKKAVGSTGFSKGKNGEILCETHAREPTPTTSSSSVPTGQVSTGIRFDHRTKTAYKVEGTSTLGSPTTTSAPTTTSTSYGLSAPAETGGRRVSLTSGPAKVTCTGCFSPMMADALKCGVCGKANARRAFGERRSSAATAPTPVPTPAPKPTTAPRPSAPNIRSPPTSAPAKPPTATSPPPSSPPPAAPAPGPSSPLLCSECGSVLKAGAKFCGECGHRP